MPAHENPSRNLARALKVSLLYGGEVEGSDFLYRKARHAVVADSCWEKISAGR